MKQTYGQDEYGAWLEYGGVVQRMRWVPAGQFLMGSPENEPGRWDDEGPQHIVKFSRGYWLFDTPVTQALWQAVMGDNPSEYKSPDRPVERVSWEDCQEFIKKINKEIPGLELSLPSEAQWEYACRAGSGDALYTGPIEILDEHNAPALDVVAWYGGNSQEGTRPVKKKQPNSWGLYDMLGNVWEWTADAWHKNYNGAPANGDIWDETEPGVGRRVIRGGSWGSGARLCRCACRSWNYPVDRSGYIGFRCACCVTPR